MDRRRAREEALCLLFEYSFNGEKTAQALLDGAAAERELVPDEYIVRVVTGVVEHCEELDQGIEPYLKGWKKNRLSRVALALLRLAVFEIEYMDDIPDSVTINEAVELAKRYDDEKGSAFVNGLLGSYVRGRAGGEARE